MEKEGVIMPVIDAKISYKTPALFDDRLIINIFLRETPRVKIKFTYEVKNQKNELICTGETTLAFLNSVSRKPIRCPESFISIFEY
jgi:acyl-CoA thioester hydrolase